MHELGGNIPLLVRNTEHIIEIQIPVLFTIQTHAKSQPNELMMLHRCIVIEHFIHQTGHA